MPISERDLKDLVAAGVIDAGTAERIAAHFKGAGAFTVAGESLWRKPGLKQPGGLLFTLAVWMTPLAVFGVQYALGWWPREARASYQEYYPRSPWPSRSFPLAFALWFLSLDLAALLIGSHGLVAFEQKQLITLLFGATVLGVTYLLDRRTDQDYAFWLYLFGLVAFWGALTYDGVGSVTYCLINLGLMLVAVLLQRKTFMVFGAIGVYSYLGHLAFDVFRNSLLFPAALTALGIAIIAAGVWYRSREAAVEAALLRVLPGATAHPHHESGGPAPRGVEAQPRPHPASAQPPPADRLRRKIQRQRAGGVEHVDQRPVLAERAE